MKLKKLNRRQLRKMINESIKNEGLGYFSSENKNDVFGAAPNQAMEHAKKYGKAYYIYKSKNDGNVYVDLYDKDSSQFPDYIETDKSEKDVSQEDIKKFYKGT